MDPWYYLDLETNVKDDYDDELHLSEICSMGFDGSWILNTDGYDGHIIFREKEYKSIEFNNNTKILTCIGTISKTFTLSIT